MDKKYLIAGIITISSIGIGFGLTKVIYTTSVNKTATVDAPVVVQTQQPVQKPRISQKVEPKLDSLNLKETEVQVEETTTATDDKALVDTKLSKDITDKFLSKEEPEKKPEMPKMSASEFKRLLLNMSDHSILGGKNPKVAKVVRIVCKNINSDERKPEDLQGIRDKILYGAWQSVDILQLGYDTENRINSVTIQPVY